jgi:hypothetical protein
MARRLDNEKLEGIWKEEVPAWYEVLSRNFSGGSERNHEQAETGQSAVV